MEQPPQRQPHLATLYADYLTHQDAAQFRAGVAGRYSSGTLERLAEHASAQIRRGAVTALGLLADYASNAVLGRALLDKDRTVRLLADNAIRCVWMRIGEPAHEQTLEVLVRLNAARRFDDAIRRATRLIDDSVWIAEAWNQRAIAYFSLGQYPESIRDCHQVLEINPYHFGAAAGMGQAYLRLGNHVSALECFRRALRLNPDLEGVRVQAERLARLVEGRKGPGGQ